MVVIKQKGNFEKTSKFFERAKKRTYLKILERYAQEGVQALSSATPVNTGLTAQSWGYEIASTKNGYVISWTNSNVVDGVPIAIILQYGHGTGTGGYVEGLDYINPALKPIFDKMANDAWKEVIE